MIIRNKTNAMQLLRLADESVLSVRPFRTITVADGTVFDTEIFIEERTAPIINKNNKKSTEVI